jgi:nitroreductase
MPLLELGPDELLTTTRSVRRRLDFDRRPDRKLVEQCLEIAFQAPNGSNLNSWHWIVLDDRDLIGEAARIYNAGLDDYIASLGERQGAGYVGASIPRFGELSRSVDHLRENLHRAPVLLLPLLAGRTQGVGLFHEASLWGSILQAVWSFMLALRARGLGSAWTTGHLPREEEMAELLGIPMDRYQQVGLFPVAYTLGTDFRPAWRRPVEEVVSWNCFHRADAGSDADQPRTLDP